MNQRKLSQLPPLHQTKPSPQGARTTPTHTRRNLSFGLFTRNTPVNGQPSPIKKYPAHPMRVWKRKGQRILFVKDRSFIGLWSLRRRLCQVVLGSLVVRGRSLIIRYMSRYPNDPNCQRTLSSLILLNPLNQNQNHATHLKNVLVRFPILQLVLQTSPFLCGSPAQTLALSHQHLYENHITVALRHNEPSPPHMPTLPTVLM